MTTVHQVLTAVAILATGVIYGTDVFCAAVLRASLRQVGDRALGSVAGFVHHYGDRRLPLPGVLGLVSTLLAAVTAVIGRGAVAVVADLVALLSLAAWFAIYARVSAPLNRVMTEAARTDRTLEDIRALQARWDGVIDVRALLQGLAVAALFAGAVWG